MSVEKYLKPSVINQIKRLDLRAQFVVKGFLHGLHASPFHGFSVEFSEHRKYSHGDDLKDIDWQVFAKTDKYYVKKFESETNITGYLVMDLSSSMGYTFEQELSKFDYAICLAAALAYLMVMQQDRWAGNVQRQNSPKPRPQIKTNAAGQPPFVAFQTRTRRRDRFPTQRWSTCGNAKDTITGDDLF